MELRQATKRFWFILVCGTFPPDDHTTVSAIMTMAALASVTRVEETSAPRGTGKMSTPTAFGGEFVDGISSSREPYMMYYYFASNLCV